MFLTTKIVITRWRVYKILDMEFKTKLPKNGKINTKMFITYYYLIASQCRQKRVFYAFSTKSTVDVGVKVINLTKLFVIA